MESSHRYKCIHAELRDSRNRERGLRAQMTMAPTGRIPDDYDPSPRGARRGAVLIALVSHPERGIELPLIERTDNGGPHGGQIALPGGGMEPSDRDDEIRTALRESREEIATPDTLHALGSLFPLFVPVSNYTITPVVAVPGDGGFSWDTLVPNPGEVQRVLRISAHDLFNGRDERSLQSRGRDMVVPAYVTRATVCAPHVDEQETREIVVWGATAMMLAELEVVLETCGDGMYPRMDQ